MTSLTKEGLIFIISDFSLIYKIMAIKIEIENGNLIYDSLYNQGAGFLDYLHLVRELALIGLFDISAS